MGVISGDTGKWGAGKGAITGTPSVGVVVTRVTGL